MPISRVKSICWATALKATEIFSKHGAKNPSYFQNVEQMAQSLPQLQRHRCSELTLCDKSLSFCLAFIFLVLRTTTTGMTLVP